MWPARIAYAVVLLVSAFCFTLAGVLFVHLPNVESPERYLGLGFGLVLLYMGGRMLAVVIWPPKPKDPKAPIEIPPLDQVRGRTKYNDGTAKWRNVTIAIGVIFLAASLDAAREQPIVLVVTAVAVGVLVGACVMIWRQIQYGGARLELAAPARRGDVMRGVITTSGFGWTVAGRGFDASIELIALRVYRAGRKSSSVVVARASANAWTTRDGNDMRFQFTTTVPVIDTSEGRFSWNVQLETEDPNYRATFLIDVA